MCGVVGSVLSNEVITVEYVIQIMKSMVDNEMDDVENDCDKHNGEDNDVNAFASGSEIGKYDNVGNDSEGATEDVIRDDFGKSPDLNGDDDVSCCEDISTLQAMNSFVSDQPHSTAFSVDLMKLYNTLTYFGVPHRVVAKINGQILGMIECWGFGPGNKVDNLI
ncbi:hypothetical protein DEO72_LG10g1358 [Vigna unguiculata]|uniref:Uncharacterized protein n=1 Tax=Vigna unguiculata TaxID=3917 RepID=A0A4D6NB84_VIGUN|nr:hypothetical protein DEO72_LG10g1358 [Vigna unguiculata]